MFLSVSIIRICFINLLFPFLASVNYEIGPDKKIGFVKIYEYSWLIYKYEFCCMTCVDETANILHDMT